MEIKPIETHYAGCRFRSRLEARWAVFFDHLGVEWQYEPQGYEVEGTRYLPDFLLPEYALFVEVKAVLSHADFMKMLRSIPGLPTSAHPVRPSLLLLGPIPRPGAGWCHSQFGMVQDLVIWQNVFFEPPNGIWVTKPVGHAAPFGRDFVEHATEEFTQNFRHQLPTAVVEPRLIPDPDVDNAYAAARSARFEYGESG